MVDPEHPGRIIYLISSWGPRGGGCLLLGRWTSKIEENLLNGDCDYESIKKKFKTMFDSCISMVKW